jgi:hypothetical protein
LRELFSSYCSPSTHFQQGGYRGTGRDAELPEDVLGVMLRGPRTYSQSFRNPGIGHSASQEPGYFDFSCGEAELNAKIVLSHHPEACALQLNQDRPTVSRHNLGGKKDAP